MTGSDAVFGGGVQSRRSTSVLAEWRARRAGQNRNNGHDDVQQKDTLRIYDILRKYVSGRSIIMVRMRVVFMA